MSGDEFGSGEEGEGTKVTKVGHAKGACSLIRISIDGGLLFLCNASAELYKVTHRAVFISELQQKMSSRV